MAEYLSPGVYVEEFASGGKPMEAVGTSTAGLVGLAERGTVGGVPQLVTSFSDFKRKYGSYLSENEFGQYRFLAYAVENFFLNGGSRCFISRVAPNDAVCATATNTAFSATAKNPGVWGNDIKIIVTPTSKAKTQVLEIMADGSYKVKKSVGFNAGDVLKFSDGNTDTFSKIIKSRDNILTLETALPNECVDTSAVPAKFITTCEFNVEIKYDDISEIYENVSFNISEANYLEKVTAKSNLAVFTKTEVKDSKGTPFADISGDEKLSVFTVSFAGGSNGTSASLTPADFIGVDNGAGNRTGIQAFIDNDVVSLMAVPGITDASVELALVAHCENLGSRFAVLDIPKDVSKIDDIITHRNAFDTSYSALYHPWLEIFDPLDKKNIMIPPSGSVLGIYARSDNTRGVHKAPANEVVRGCVGLSIPFNKGEQDILNPVGVNLIRSFPGQGIRVWGARTLSSDPSWRYINVRRLFIYLEESIKANTSWVVFEPNDERLWARVQRTIEGFLRTMWRDGALAGASEADAFFCNIGTTTMTKEDIDNGRLICVIGVAPVKPAEFVIFRITQKTAE